MLELIVQNLFEREDIKWSQPTHEVKECQFLEIHAPKGLDLSKNTEYASQAALWGIEVCIIIFSLSLFFFFCFCLFLLHLAWDVSQKPEIIRSYPSRVCQT